MLVSAKLPKYGNRSEVPTSVCRITNGTNATYVRPSENTSGRVPGGNRCATRCGSTGQCTNVRSAQNWWNSTGHGSGGAITGKLTAPSWHAAAMSSPLIWSTGRYESMGERIASSAAEVVDAADRCAPVRDAALVDHACGTGNAALVAALPRCTRDRGGHHVPVIGCGRELRDEAIADTRVLCSATSMPQNANRCG